MKDISHLKQSGQDEAIAQRWLTILEELARNTFWQGNAATLNYVNVFIRHFLELFTQAEFRPSSQQILRFIDLNSIISNLTALSDFRTTDLFVKKLWHRRSPNDVGKLLALYSPRNHVLVTQKEIFDCDAYLGSRWFFAYLKAYEWGCVSEHAYERLRSHVECADERLTYATPAMHHAYFGCTYINPESEKFLKRKINALYRSRFTNQDIINSPMPRRIAVITQFWRPKHVVYRAFKPLLDELARDYELVLIHLGAKQVEIETTLFREVRFFSMESEPYDFGAINSNEFALVIYPDIGMNMESICLSNLRLAPVQIATYGHPASTGGSEIDYFIGGADVELALLAGEHYSERLVLIPGCGQANPRPCYEPKAMVPKETPLRIACCWAAQKINFPHLMRLRAACENLKQPVKFVFSPFASKYDNDNAYLSMERELAEILGADRIEMQPPLSYEKYLESLEGCHFAVDSFPFGGYSTAIDLLWLRKPLVALRGKHANSRVASYLLERMGLECMIADTPEEFILLLRKMISDADFRNGTITRAREADRENALLSKDYVSYWRKTIAYLLGQHDSIRNEAIRAPIFIE